MCTWLIEAPFGYHVYLYFYHFSLEYGGSYCPYDFLEIRDGNTLSSPLITKACGSLGYFYMYSSGRFLLLRFRTDGRVQGAGFAGYYRTYSYRKGYNYSFDFLNILIERLSYGFEMKTREQNKKSKRTEIERFYWLIERIKKRVGFGWLRAGSLWRHNNHNHSHKDVYVA